MGPHHYTPSIPTNTNASQPHYNSLVKRLSYYIVFDFIQLAVGREKSKKLIELSFSQPRMGGNKLHVAPVNETLHIDTHSEPMRYELIRINN